MSVKNKFIITAAAAMLATAANAAEAPKEKSKAPEKEKCFGVAKKGKNDCSWSGGSCHGSLTKDGDKTAYILLPKGTCDRLVGGSLKSG